MALKHGLQRHSVKDWKLLKYGFIETCWECRGQRYEHGQGSFYYRRDTLCKNESLVTL